MLKLADTSLILINPSPSNVNELYNWQVKTMKLIRCIHHSISISASNQNPWGSVSWVLLTKKMKYKSWNNNGLLKRFSPKERAP